MSVGHPRPLLPNQPSPYRLIQNLHGPAVKIPFVLPLHTLTEAPLAT